MDVYSKAKRSELMSKIRSKDTKPEIVVRRLLHSLGYRYRLHRDNLPGTPDIVFPRKFKAVFVHGCFWHRHQGCKKTSMPASRVDFWTRKFDENTTRDRQNFDKLRTLGWGHFIVWECEVKNIEVLANKLKNFLEEDRH